ncbi:DUF92 domain-containing protein [archaeon]|nr:DUF92 domain-containing protein [archaeon]
MDFPIKLFIMLVVLAVVSFITFKAQALNKKGIMLANAVGLAAFLLGGLKAFSFILALFMFAEAGTRYGRRRKEQKFERRSISNIIGNTLTALAMLFLQNYVAFASAVSCALADTLSGELGMMTGKKPRLITTLKEVEVGEEGAVTLFGLLAAIASSFVIGAMYFVLFSQSIKALMIVWIAGFLGSVADSFLGALLERKKIIGNTTTNFLACSIAALISILLLGL